MLSEDASVIKDACRRTFQLFPTVYRRQEAGALGCSEPCVLYVLTLQLRVFVFLLFCFWLTMQKKSILKDKCHTYYLGN